MKRGCMCLLALASNLVAAGTALAEISVHPQGLSSFRLGTSLNMAAQRMASMDRAALQIGPGCDEREQSVVTGMVAGMPATVMAMADAQGQIVEVVASVPHQGLAVPEHLCQARANVWVRALLPNLGTGHATGSVSRGSATVSQTWFSPRAKVEARWFAGGGSCDLSLHFGDTRGSQ